MSEYKHDLKKFSDSGLQLRLPVDLVPAGQYSRITNAVPYTEGEIRTRSGLDLISHLYQIAAVSVLSRVDTTVSVAAIATTIYPNGYSVGDNVSITVSGSSPSGISIGYGLGPYGGGAYGGGVGIVPGIYPVTITGIIDPRNFTFTPGIPGVWNFTEIGIPVFAQAFDFAFATTLTATQVNTIYRLNHDTTGIGDRLAAMSGRLYRAPIPFGNNFMEMVHSSQAAEPPSVSNGFSGGPLSIISFRFTLGSDVWAIIADSAVMYKFQDAPNGDPLLFLLGNPVPSVPAQATAGSAAGNLNSTGGALYDWRYTYYDGYVETEGNPSPGTVSSTIATQTSTLQKTPDSAIYPGTKAFTGVTNTGGTANNSQSDVFPLNQSSCRWYGFTNPATTPYSLTLNVTWQVIINRVSAGGCVANLNYSTNGGTSFTNFATVINVSADTNTASVDLPLGTDLTQVVVQAYGFCNPNGTGNTMQIVVADIGIDAGTAPASAAIAVVNKDALVDVALPRENDGRVTGIRLYRRGGSLPDAWRLVGTFPLSGLPSVPGIKLCTSGVNDGAYITGPAWSNPGNATSAVAFATVHLAGTGASQVSNWLDATGFGFSVPTTDPIQGITVTMSVKVNTAVSDQSYFVVTLLNFGVPIGTWDGNFSGIPPGTVETSKGTLTPTAATTFTFGGPNSLWATAWTPAAINDPGFGAHILVYNPTGTAHDFSINDVQIAVNTNIVEIIDNVGDAQLSAQPILELDNDQPVSSVDIINQPLSFIWGPVGPEARVLGVGDPARPEAVYFSKPGNPDAWPPENFLLVTDPGTPAIAGCVYNTRNYAFSREAIFELVEGLGTGSTFTPFKTPSSHGLYSPWGLAIGPAMYFISKDGIYQTTGGQDVSLVENDIKPLFPTYDHPGISVQGYQAVDYSDPNTMRLAYHNGELYFTYQGLDSGIRQTLIYDILKKRWRAASYNPGPFDFYTEPGTTSSLLVGGGDGDIYQAGGTSDEGQAIGVLIQTGAQDQGMPLNRKQYGNVIFDLDPGGATVANPITIIPLINGETVAEAAIHVTGTGRQQVPLDLSDYFAFNTEFLIDWTSFDTGGGVFSDPVLFQYDILWFPEPVGVRHWESQPSSLGVEGFLHVRDMYVTIRSTSSVTMAMTFWSGTAQITQSYTIASTGGDRQKIYIPLASNKGLLYQWAFDSDQEFRLYEDSETRTKGWLTVLGYQIAKPFGGEASS